MALLTNIVVWVVIIICYVRYLEAVSIFYPGKDMNATPADIGLDYEDVYFETQDHLEINGWLIKNPRAKSTVIFFHGNAGNISGRLEKINIFHRLGVHVFIIDYRGYGRSEGRPTEKGLYLDALAAYDYLHNRKDIDKDKLVAYGVSLGGVAAVDLATQRSLAALIVDSSFSHAADMAKRMFPYIPAFLIKTKFDNLTKVKQVTIPKLFIHSPVDKTVPYKLGQKLFQAASDPKIFLEVEGEHDETHEDDSIFADGVRNFLMFNQLI